MRRTVIFLSILAVALSAGQALANSQTYRIRVTIPEIIGVNVPDPDAPTLEAAKANSQELNSQIEEIVRNNETFLLETIVAR